MGTRWSTASCDTFAFSATSRASIVMFCIPALETVERDPEQDVRAGSFVSPAPSAAACLRSNSPRGTLDNLERLLLLLLVLALPGLVLLYEFLKGRQESDWPAISGSRIFCRHGTTWLCSKFETCFSSLSPQTCLSAIWIAFWSVQDLVALADSSTMCSVLLAVRASPILPLCYCRVAEKFRYFPKPII